MKRRSKVLLLGVLSCFICFAFFQYRQVIRDKKDKKIVWENIVLNERKSYVFAANPSLTEDCLCSLTISSDIAFNHQDPNRNLERILAAIYSLAKIERVKGLCLTLSAKKGMANKYDYEKQFLLGKALDHFKATGKKVFVFGKYYNPTNYLIAKRGDRIDSLAGGEVTLPLWLEGVNVMEDAAFRRSFSSWLIPEELHKANVRDCVSAAGAYKLDKPLEDTFQTLLPYFAFLKREVKDDQRIANFCKEAKKRLETTWQEGDLLYPIKAEQAKGWGYIDEIYKDEKEWEEALFRECKLRAVALSSCCSNQDQPKDGWGIDLILLQGDVNNVQQQLLLKRLSVIAQMDKVCGVILAVDSRGGYINTALAIKEKIGALKKKGIPVVVYSQGECLSAAYWISAYSGPIITTPLTRVGAVGVIGLLGNEEDTTKLYEEMTSDIAEARRSTGLTQRKLKHTGAKAFSAEEALNLKMIDKVGSLQDAINMLRSQALAKLPQAYKGENKKGDIPIFYHPQLINIDAVAEHSDRA